MAASTVLPSISSSQSQKEVVANAWAVSLASAALFGYKPETSGLLVFGYYGGTFPNGAYGTIADGTVTVADATTNYVECDKDGVVSVNAVGFTAGRNKLYQIVAAGGAITSVIDYRTSFNLDGSVKLDPSIENTLTAHAGGTKALALAMSAAFDIHRFSVCASANDSSLLPPAVVGRRDFVKNSGAANMAVYGAGTDQIDDTATATSFVIAPGGGKWFVCISAGNWYSSN